ncbi:MAG: S8 family serine peptidase [Candidatus Sericytochromatia bacterium]|nr:S8 family serine peptidase [Candidatus Sericytochromatia bacterium]
MKRTLLCLLALALAGCSATQPWLPLGTFAMGVDAEAPTPDVAGAEDAPVGRVAGYGLQTLGATDLIVRFAPNAKTRRPTRGTLVGELATGAQLYQLDSEAELQAELEELWENDDCLLAEPDAPCQALGMTNDPELLSAAQWHHEKIGTPAAWDVTQGAATMAIAVVDSGLDISSGLYHPDLQGRVLALGQGTLNYAGGGSSSDYSDGSNYCHGNRVAGIIAATANNGLGGVGVAPGCMIVPLKAATVGGGGGSLPSFKTSALINAIKAAPTKANGDVKVINVSVGTPIDSPSLREACDQAVASGVVVVAAAGNMGTATPVYPAAYESVLSVGGTTATDSRWSASNYGPWVRISAPAANIRTTGNDNTYVTESGTSYSAAMVSGAVALLRSVKAWSPEVVMKALRTTGAPVTGFTGAAPKRLDIPKALALAAMPSDSAPVLSKAMVLPTASQATLTFSVSEPAFVSVKVAEDKLLTLNPQEYTVAAPTTRATVQLAGLQTAKTYYYQITARDTAVPGLQTKGSVGKFLTALPKVSKVFVKAQTHTAKVSWLTTAAVTGTLRWGTTAAAAADPAASTIVATSGYEGSHAVDLTGLAPNTSYYYQISGATANGDVMPLKTGVVKTGKQAITATFVGASKSSLNFKLVGKTPQRVEVAFDVDPVQLLANPTYTVPTGTGLAREQTFSIPSLTPNTAYHVLIRATDSFGTVTTLKPLMARTLSRGPVELGIEAVTTTNVTLAVHFAEPPTELKLYIGGADRFDFREDAATFGLSDCTPSFIWGLTTQTYFRLTSTNLPTSSAGTGIATKAFVARLRIGPSPYTWSDPIYFNAP